MKECKDVSKIRGRIHKAIGQLQGIDRILDKEDVTCEDVIIRLNAVTSALHGCGRVVLEENIRTCMLEGMESGNVDEAVETMSVPIQRYANLIK